MAGLSDISDGAWSRPAAVETTCAPTTAITLNIASTTAHSISLNWRASEGGQTSYVLERSADGSLYWVDVAVLNPSDSSFIDSGLPSGRRFYYRLIAVNAGGSTASRVTSARTLFEVMLPAVSR